MTREPSPRAAASSFPADRLRRLIEIERRHFWFAGRRALVARLLARYVGRPPTSIVDVGVGGGAFCETLAHMGYRMTAVDFLPDGLARLNREASGVHAVQSSAEALSLRDGAFGAALALDVLEHVDDRAAARELWRILRPGGVLVIMVPAFPWLWSYRDSAAGHQRRYGKATLADLLRGAGFEVGLLGYYQFFLFPLALASRMAGRATSAVRDLEDTPPALVNALFALINRTEVRLGARCAWPWGSSLYAVARRSGEGNGL